MPKREISFTRYFAELPDPRVNRTKKHRLDDILVRLFCGRVDHVDRPAMLCFE